MKNLFLSISFLLTVGVTAQNKKATVQKPLAMSEVQAGVVSNEAASKRNMAALTSFVSISPEIQVQLAELFTTKYRMLSEVSNSDERKKYIADIIAAKLEASLDGNLLSKIKSNAVLYQSLLQ